MASDTAHVSAAHAPNGTTSLPTTTWVASNAIPAGSTTAKEVHREGVASDPPADKTTPAAVQVHRTVEDLPLEGGEMVADPSVTPEAHRGRGVHSHRVRRAICPPGQCQVFHHQWHLKEPSLSMEVGQGLPSTIPHDWWQDFTVLVGGRTWSMCSGSITNTTLPPLRRQNG